MRCLVEEQAQERGGCEHVVHRFVRVLEHDPVPLADRLQAMVLRKRLEQAECVERARRSRRAVGDPGAREGVLEHP